MNIDEGKGYMISRQNIKSWSVFDIYCRFGGSVFLNPFLSSGDDVLSSAGNLCKHRS